MQFRKIFEGRIDSASNGATASFPLKPRGGGRLCKGALYQVKAIQSDGSGNARITVTVDHSPDGQVAALHSTPINQGNPGTTLPRLLSGNTDQSLMLGEFLHVTLSIQHATTGGAVWAHVQVYELRKPF